jgi:redox-sensitive bicupin YhaK (pirin superfamily)
VRTETVEVRRADERFVSRAGGAETRHSFSFGEHYDPANVGFGALLVNNDDLVCASTGYDDHPHRDAEIVTWVLSGSLVHQDSRGLSGIVYPGLAQRMSAGSGIVHAERNDAYRLDPAHAVQPVHFVQMWVQPDAPGAEPNYQQREIVLDDLDRDWVPVASGRHPDAAVSLLSAESTLWVTRLAPGVARRLPAGPRLHVYLAAGEVEIESVGRLTAGDAARMTGRAGLLVTGIDAAELLVWELAA